jgi:homospermidine synthase
MKLKTWGYNGFITLKVKPSELWVGNEERVLQNLEYAKNYYSKHYLNFK